jgi:hypothetical protein
MITEKLNKLPIIALGAINGILFGVVLEVVLRSMFLVATYLRSSQSPSVGITICHLGYPFRWWYFPLLSFITVTSATFIVHHFAAKYIKSTIWFWQIVSVVTIFVFATFEIIYAFYNWYLESFEFEELYSLMFGLKSKLIIAYPIIAIFNLLFALLLKRFKTHLP